MRLAGKTALITGGKAAVRSFARTWSGELAPRKIRVNAVMAVLRNFERLRFLMI